MTRYLNQDGTGITENIEEAGTSICHLEGGCGCVTKSIESEDRTHFSCEKCGNTK